MILVPSTSAVVAAESSATLKNITVLIALHNSPFVSTCSDFVLHRLSIQDQSPNAPSPAMLSTTTPGSSLSLVDSFFSDFSISSGPFTSSGVTSKVSIVNTAFSNITEAKSAQQCPELSSVSSTTTAVINSRFESVTNGFYGTVTSDINRGHSQLFTNTSFLQSTATYTGQSYGGSQRVYEADVTFKTCTFDYCEAEGAGGGLMYSNTDGAVWVEDCHFTDCIAGTDGGAFCLHNGASATLKGNEIVACHGKIYAGGMVVNDADAIIQSNTIDQCSGGGGSAFHRNLPRSQIIFSNNTITSCLSTYTKDFGVLRVTTYDSLTTIAYNSLEFNQLGTNLVAIEIRVRDKNLIKIFDNNYLFNNPPITMDVSTPVDDITFEYEMTLIQSPLLLSKDGASSPPSTETSLTSHTLKYSLSERWRQFDQTFVPLGDYPLWTVKDGNSLSVPSMILDVTNTTAVGIASISGGSSLAMTGTQLTLPSTFHTTPAFRTDASTLSLKNMELTGLTLTSVPVFLVTGASSVLLDTITAQNIQGFHFMEMGGSTEQTVKVKNSIFDTLSANDPGTCFNLKRQYGTLVLDHSSFTSISNSQDAGIVRAEYEGHTVTIQSCSFTSCEATTHSSVVRLLADSECLIDDSTFTECSSGSDVGVLALWTTSSPVKITNCVFDRCGSNSSQIGVLETDSGNLNISNCLFLHCFAGTHTILFIRGDASGSHILDNLTFIASATASVGCPVDIWTVGNPTFTNVFSTSHQPHQLISAGSPWTEKTETNNILFPNWIVTAGGDDEDDCAVKGKQCQTVAFVVSQCFAENTARTQTEMQTMTLLDAEHTIESITIGNLSITIDGTLVGSDPQSTLLAASSVSGPLLLVSSGRLVLSRLKLKPLLASSFVSSVSGEMSLKGCSVDGSYIAVGSSFSTSFLSTNAGSLSIEGTTFTSISTAAPLISQTSTIISMSSSFFTSIVNTATAGSVLSGTISSGKTLTITGTTFDNCKSKGKGGVLNIELAGTGSISISSSTEFVDCSCESGKGNVLFLKGGNLESLLAGTHEKPSGLNGIKPELTTSFTTATFSAFFGSDTETNSEGSLLYYWFPHKTGPIFVSESGEEHELCGLEGLPCSTLNFVFPMLSNTKKELTLSSDVTLSTSLSSPSTGASISSSSSPPKSLIFASTGQFVVEDGPLSFSSIGLTLHTSITQPLFVVKGSTLTLPDSVTITNPPSATHSASLFSIEGGTLTLSGTVFDFTVPFSSSSALLTQTGGSVTLDTVSLSSVTLASASVIEMEGTSTLSVSGSEFKTITQTGSGGGVFLKTNGDSDQLVSIISCSFDTVSSVGDGGAILAELGAGSTLTVTDTTFTSCSCSGKGGALSIVLSSTGSFALQTGTSFESCSATGSGSAVFVQTPSLASAITRTSMALLAPYPLTPTPALLHLYRGWNTASISDAVPLVLFLAEVGSTGFASSSGSDGELCGFSVYPCSSLSTVQTRLAANGSKTEGKLNPITIQLQTALEQKTSFSCGAHAATITGNTITLSEAGQFSTSSSSSSLTLTSLTLLFASSQTQPAISVAMGKIVVSDCTVGNGVDEIPVSFGSVSGGSLKLSGTNTMKSVSTSSPLFIVSSGTLEIESGTTLTHSPTTRIASLFALSGGSTMITSLSVPSLTLGSTHSVFSLTSTASLSLSSIAFALISTEGSGSVIHSTSTGKLSLSSVSFSSCNCGSSGKGRSVFISRSSFSLGDVVMKDVSIITAGTTGSHEVYLEGEDVGAAVTSDWASLIGTKDATLTKAKLEQVFGSDSTNTTNIGPIGYHLYPHTSGALFVSEGFWDHGKCGQERLPCSTLDFAFSLLSNTKKELTLSSDVTLSTSLSSPSTGASISSSSSPPKSLIFASTGQFVVEDGPLSFSSIGLTLHTSITQPLFVVKGSTLTLPDSVTIRVFHFAGDIRK
ncbi:hypothetical protein BLNAU_3862 [Blattamonas nauphoetae]|uniref:Uncharacterized protein n=1 Tax=Blattamonas nauphoetae TaxID=2049346 RepID=A0ABQ9YBI3_9EUKA|nr:hypothetical protein BLNAU_3862 [Blattamonas nauphoetae]